MRRLAIVAVVGLLAGCGPEQVLLTGDARTVGARLRVDLGTPRSMHLPAQQQHSLLASLGLPHAFTDDAAIQPSPRSTTARAAPPDSTHIGTSHNGMVVVLGTVIPPPHSISLRAQVTGADRLIHVLVNGTPIERFGITTPEVQPRRVDYNKRAASQSEIAQTVGAICVDPRYDRDLRKRADAVLDYLARQSRALVDSARHSYPGWITIYWHGSQVGYFVGMGFERTSKRQRSARDWARQYAEGIYRELTGGALLFITASGTYSYPPDLGPALRDLIDDIRAGRPIAMNQPFDSVLVSDLRNPRGPATE